MDLPSSADARGVWDRIAAWWDDFLGEGNAFQHELIMPTTDRLLGDVRGKAVLDCCCGNGNYARRLASRGAIVTAFDGSSVFIEKAKQRNSETTAIDYHVADACDEAAVVTVAQERSFDAAVCSMALMDLPTIEPLLRAVKKILKPGGVFVWSVSHPCFNSNHSRMTAQLINEDGLLEQRFGVEITKYLDENASRAAGMLHQPEPHWLFHRPLNVLLQSCFAAGFVVDALEEPAYNAKSAKGKNAFSWAKRPAIPPALIVRLR